MNNAFTREELINVLRGWHKNFNRVGRSHERNVQALAEAADVLGQGKWISVKDRLPEKLNENNQVYLTEEVIGFDGESAYIGQFKVYKYDGLRTFFDGNCFRSDITHWMPLPEPPKEDAE